jgi:hypothetical protein
LSNGEHSNCKKPEHSQPPCVRPVKRAYRRHQPAWIHRYIHAAKTRRPQLLTTAACDTGDHSFKQQAHRSTGTVNRRLRIFFAFCQEGAASCVACMCGYELVQAAHSAQGSTAGGSNPAGSLLGWLLVRRKLQTCWRDGHVAAQHCGRARQCAGTSMPGALAALVD